MPSVKKGAAYAVTATLAVAPLAVATPALAAPLAPEHALVINEVQSKGPAAQLGGADWIEITNISTETVDASGVIVSDNKDDDVYRIAEGTDLAPGDYLVLTVDDFLFGLGGDDSVRLFAAGTTVTGGVIDPAAVPFDATTWAGHTSDAGASWGRLPDGTGEFTSTQDATPGASNSPAPVTADSAFLINEVESAGEDKIELVNVSHRAISPMAWCCWTAVTRTPPCSTAMRRYLPATFWSLPRAWTSSSASARATRCGSYPPAPL